jgi:hypothetical protein
MRKSSKSWQKEAKIVTRVANNFKKDAKKSLKMQTFSKKMHKNQIHKKR